MRHFWRGDRFIDALGADDTSSGEANLWPFWNGVVEDRDVMATAFDTLRRDGYTEPYPLRYETRRRPEIEVWLTRHVLPDYQGSTVWTSLGSMYLQLLRRSIRPTPRCRRSATSSGSSGTAPSGRSSNTKGNCWSARGRS